MNRHKGLDWAKVQERLEAQPQKLRSINEMERTGGDPDDVYLDQLAGEILFFDCSTESADGRRNFVTITNTDQPTWIAEVKN